MLFLVKKFTLPLFFLVIVLANSQSGRAEAGAQFPIYPIIAPNVRFWEKIYRVYSHNQGVLHDKNDLNIVYAVIDLVPRNVPGAKKINKNLIQLVRLRHKNILKKFANGEKPSTKEEQQIFSFFTYKNSPAFFLEALENIRLQTGLKEAFRKGVIRSGGYMPLIKRIMRTRGLPVELAYLPHVESSFNLNAHSKAAAVGLWQFTKYTGKEYLTVNNLVDERFDVYLASQAAAKFLQENHRQLGSWPLALTAYNYGRTGMVRAQKQWGTYPKIIANHETGIFKFASKNFYSEFIAAVRVARRLENDRSLIKDRPWINVTFRLRNYIDTKDLCEYFNIERDNFEKLNPALRQPVLAGRKYIPKGTLLRLPATKRIRKGIKRIPNRLFHKKQISGKKNKAKKDKTATVIADKFKTSVKTLERADKQSGGAGAKQKQKNKVITLRAAASSKAPAGKTKAGKVKADNKNKVPLLNTNSKRTAN